MYLTVEQETIASPWPILQPTVDLDTVTKTNKKKDQLIDTDYTGFLVNAYIKKDYYGLNLIK